MSEATTHDYTVRRWGHDFTIHAVHGGGTQLTVSGWGSGIKAGDYLILPNGKKSSRYHVDEIQYHRDPSDMWNAKLWFAPRFVEEDGA